ncbi:MAG: sensor histidine kinase [Thermodesulfobacteriota bacterium]
MKNPSVLIVDDDVENIDALSEILKAYEVRAATSGEKALGIAGGGNPPDLILLDIIMPAMDGYEVCETLKRNPATRNIPVIFITVMGEETHELKGFALGAVDYITKPFSPGKVRARVATHLELKRHRDRLEEMVREQSNRLIHADRLATLGVFSAALAHEINNPLSFIFGSAQLIQQKMATGDPRQEFVLERIERIMEGTRRISKLIKTLKGYARQGKMTLQSCLLGDVIEDAVEMLNFRLKNSLVTVDRSGVAAGVRVVCDRQRLSQVFVNLLTNAMDAMEACGGTIAVAAAESGGSVRIQVADDGPGIDEEERRNLFAPFVTTKAPDKGTGLGLYIAKSIIEDHKGEIRLLPSDGRGAVFEVQLPGSDQPRGDGYAQNRSI